MKFFTTLSLATAASAATLEHRQAPSKQIGSFSASCIPHSAFCNYQFTVKPDPSLPPSHCNGTYIGSGTLPAVGDGKCADNAAYTWGIVSTQDGGYRFGVWYPLNSRSNITYCHQITPDEIEVVDGGSVQTAHYIGPTEFDATVDACF
ncbi:uncharacterized protein B0I36DRAFT_331078 [Microdochium trichocladiopsis]|uniref:Hypersensitive response-inducing protein n=1 Tax=Microdochium trichocladiopsis TaxID=1682393 RepID=A0A9P8Y3S0_9PEZI|nr:uncharacterized protein B0I36DRAFT_331078 [Microdochium trichocladiopsis]KAH7026647.1 hypothetical protein B0I36DRAFT_331078 [Microdochium trichocladiopsis]